MKFKFVLFGILLSNLAFALPPAVQNPFDRDAFCASVRLMSSFVSQTNGPSFQLLHAEFLALEPTNTLPICVQTETNGPPQPLAVRVLSFATKGPEDVIGRVWASDQSDTRFGGARFTWGNKYSEEEVAAGRMRNRLARQQILDFLVSEPEPDSEALWASYWEAAERLWIDDAAFGHGPLCRAAAHCLEDGVSRVGLIQWFLGTTNFCGEARQRAEGFAGLTQPNE